LLLTSEPAEPTKAIAPELVGVGLGVGVAVGVEVGVGVAVLVRVGVAVLVRVGVAVLAGVAVGVGVGVEVDVAVADVVLLIATVSKVTVLNWVVLCEVTARPASTVPLMDSTTLEPATGVQATPSLEV
jgi:hypothetical protein